MAKEKLKFNRKRFTPLTDSQWEVIKKIIETGRKRKHSLGEVVDGIVKITRTGTQWRNLEEKPTLSFIQLGKAYIITFKNGKNKGYGEKF